MGARWTQYAVLLFCVLQLRAAGIALSGRVVDEDDAPVPGATVSVRLSGSTQAPLQALADPTGAFHLALPQAGAYLVTAVSPGFFPLADRPVQVMEGANEITLALNHIRNTSESVEVLASPSPIDVEQTNSVRQLSGPQIFEVPYPSTHDLRLGMTLMPGVMEGPASDLHFDGGGENQTQYLLNGFNISDPLTGTFATHLSVESVRSLDFLSGRYSPEYGKGSAGTLAIHTESGDDTWRYSATNFIPGFNTNQGLHLGAYTPRANISGPIVKGRAWFSDNVDGDYDQLIVTGLPKGQNSRTSYGGSNLLHAQFNLTPSNILFADFVANVNITPNNGLAPLDPIPTTVSQRNVEWFFSGKDQIYLTRGTLLEFGYAGLRTFARAAPQGTELFLITTNGRQGNYYVDSKQWSGRKQLLANLFLPAFHAAGTHQFKAGVDGDRLDYSQDTRRTGFDNIGVSGAVLRQVTFAGSGVLSRPSLEASSYIQDDWKIRPNLFVQAGVREDWDELIRQAVLSPRASFSYAPLGAKNTKISGGYAMIYDANTPQVFSQPQDQYSLSTLYNPDGSLLSGPAATVFTLGPHLRMPQYSSLSLGLEQVLPARILLSVNLLRRRGDNGLTYVNIANPGAAPPPDLAALYHTGQFAAIYQLQNSRQDHYDSAEIRLHQPFGKGYEWMASYTRSRAYSSGVMNVTVDQPALVTGNAGPVTWDAPNRFLSWGYLPTPFKNWALAYLFETRSGFPFSIVDQINNVVGSPDSHRYPNYLNLNLHVEWTTHLFGYRFALRGGLNNLTNHNNYTQVNSVLGAPNFLNFYGVDGRHFVVRIRWLGRVNGS